MFVGYDDLRVVFGKHETPRNFEALSFLNARGSLVFLVDTEQNLNAQLFRSTSDSLMLSCGADERSPQINLRVAVCLSQSVAF